MALAGLQRALALLATDEDARDRFRRDPGVFARDLALEPAELAQLTSIGDARLHAYTDSLDRKRLSECVRLLPLSARVLGPRFRTEFLRYARRTTLGEGPRRYREDAAAFGRGLARAGGAAAPSGPTRALLAHEAAGGAAVAWFRYFIPDLVVRAARGESIDDIEPCATLSVAFMGRRIFLRVSLIQRT